MINKTDICEQLSNDGRTCSMIASYEGHFDILQLLRNHINQRSDLLTRCDINVVDSVGNTALHYCCFGGNIKCAQYLIESCGANYNMKNKEGMLPIQFAVAGDHVELVSYLHKLMNNNNNNKKDDLDDEKKEDKQQQEDDDKSESGINSLHRAAMHGSLKTLKMLIDEHIISGDSTMPNLNTALHLSSQRGMSNIVDYLINHPTIELDINAQNEFGLSPLHFACIGGHSDVVSMLLKRGAIPTSRTATEATPLHLAASSGSHEICEMLIKCDRSVDAWAQDTDG